ncbi:hypothetical protein NEOLEDRAFT_1243316 [Neolentinus lepideus HHB14362 ss-1]|uniref:Uncharacterized protein n=1 Tax=Neolentinus lepideus HHB14362 ss-1 TaxID=1314782 RepID=A0A165R574_9AGAM|nr:hypothetical protein NEOLEDRAFT_1243316 [Neolentinus lepideus HHB14362 ss-1]
MGSHFSVINDTDKTVWVTHGTNLGVLTIAVNTLRALATLSAVIPGYGTAASAITMAVSAAVDQVGRCCVPRPGIPRHHAALHEIEAVLMQAGMRKRPPGQTFTSDPLCLSLVQQAEVAIVEKNEYGGLTITTGHFTVWSGATHESNQMYRMSDHIHSLEGKETINIP